MHIPTSWEARSGLTVLAAALASTLLSTSAFGQAAPIFDGSYVGAVSSTVTVGDSTTETTGDSTVAPYQNTTTTYTDETINSTLAPQTQAITYTVNGATYNGTVTYAGTGSAQQVHETSVTTTYNPGPPPSVIGTVANPDVITPQGAPTVTSVSAVGSIGNVNSFGADISTSGPVTNGAVAATETSAAVSSAGVVFASRTGTATFDPVAGKVVVDLPSAPNSYTQVSANGISTSGIVAAAGFNANGGRVSGVGNAVADTDAVNLGQLNNAIAGVNVRVDSLANSLQDLDKRANAGTAVAVAMSGGTFLPDKRFNLTANIGGYRGEAAIAGQLGVLVTENVAFNAGVATGFSKRGGTAWRGGVSLGF